MRGRGRERGEVAEPGGLGRAGVLAERDGVVLGPDDQQHRRRELVVLVADGLLVDHLEGQRRGASPPVIIRAERHPDQDVGQRLPDLRVGMDEVPLDVAADDGRVGPVDLVVVEGLLGLRRDPGAVVGQAERVLQDQVGDPAGVGQGEAGRGHAAGGVAEQRRRPRRRGGRAGRRCWRPAAGSCSGCRAWATCPSRSGRRDHPVPGSGQRLDHVLEVVAAERLAVHQHDRLAVRLRARRDVHVGHRDRLLVTGERQELDGIGVRVLFQADTQGGQRS